MTIAHIGAWKLASLIIGALAAVAFAIDPTWKMFVVGALIASIPPTITGVFALRLQAKNAVKLDRVEKNTDGINIELRSANKAQAVELKEANRQVDTAQGREDERVREKRG